MFKNLINRTIVNYILVTVGALLVGKLGIPGDLWEIARGAIEEGILAFVGGGGVVAIIVGAANGIIESQKSKIVLDGQRVEVPKPGEKPTAAQATAVKKAIATVEDRVTGRANG